MTALITGGSSGIGLAFSKLFARDGYRLLWVSLSESEQEAAVRQITALYPGVQIDALVADLSEAGAPQRVLAWTQQLGIVPDVLVNNAGFGTFGPIATQSIERNTAMIQTNVLALYQITHLFLPAMIARNSGRILHTASIAAFQPDPYLAVYGATKSFVLSFSQALHYELKQQGSAVRVTAVCPPPARTGFGSAAQMEHSKLFDSWMLVSADTIAAAGYRAMQQGRRMVVPNRWLHLLSKITRRLPTGFLMWFGAKQV
jgi:uncharacterized protein